MASSQGSDTEGRRLADVSGLATLIDRILHLRDSRAQLNSVVTLTVQQENFMEILFRQGWSALIVVSQPFPRRVTSCSIPSCITTPASGGHHDGCHAPCDSARAAGAVHLREWGYNERPFSTRSGRSISRFAGEEPRRDFVYLGRSRAREGARRQGPRGPDDDGDGFNPLRWIRPPKASGSISATKPRRCAWRGPARRPCGRT